MYLIDTIDNIYIYYEYYTYLLSEYYTLLHTYFQQQQ